MKMLGWTTCFFIIIPVGESIVWSPETLPDNAHVTACRGDSVTLRWKFRVEGGEAVEDIKWHYQSLHGTGGQTLVALDSEGLFLPAPTFSHRVQLVDNAGLSLSHVTVSNSGWYSVTVNSHRWGSYETSTRTAHVIIAEPPRTYGQLQVSHRADSAVYDNVTREWHLQLTCGTFSSLGQPPIHMEWMTPGGVVNATLSSGGDFLLVLDNPVVGGNYTCRLSPHSPPAVCLTAGDPLLVGDAVYVDETQVRFTLLEAQQAQLVAENEQLKSDNSRLQMDLVSEQQSLDILQQQLADLLKQMAEMQEHFAGTTGSGAGPYINDSPVYTHSSTVSMAESDLQELADDDVFPF